MSTAHPRFGKYYSRSLESTCPTNERNKQILIYFHFQIFRRTEWTERWATMLTFCKVSTARPLPRWICAKNAKYSKPIKTEQKISFPNWTQTKAPNLFIFSRRKWFITITIIIIIFIKFSLKHILKSIELWPCTIRSIAFHPITFSFLPFAFHDRHVWMSHTFLVMMYSF